MVWLQIVDEHNVDVFEQSFYIEPQSQIGAFSIAFTTRKPNSDAAPFNPNAENVQRGTRQTDLVMM